MNEQDPKIRDAELAEVVVEAREFCLRLEDESRTVVRPIVEAHVAAYRVVLHGLRAVLAVLPDTSDMDLTASTRASALWSLCNRDVSLALNVVGQVEAGYGVEIYPTVRAIHEANRLIAVFADREEDALLRRWIRGETPKPAAVRKAMSRSLDRENARRRASGETPIKPMREVEERIYKALSQGGHLARDSLALSVSHSRRMMVVGPTPDWGVRAYFTSFVGGVVAELIWACGRANAVAVGTDLAVQFYDWANGELERVEKAHPWPSEHFRLSPMEVEVV